MNMRHRIAPCRRHFSTSASTLKARRTKSFIKHVDEQGEIYYTVATKEQGKDLPQQPDAGKLFEMPDIVLDLEAEGVRDVRESTDKDEAHIYHKWKYSAKRKAVKARLGQMSINVGESRNKTPEMNADKTHPLHITDYDITSAALRGLTVGLQARRRERKEPQKAPGTEHKGALEEKHQPDSPERLVVTTFSHVHSKQDDNLPAAAATATQELAPSNNSVSTLAQIIGHGDPRGRPDYMRHLRIAHGIPSYTTKNDEQFIRWMMLRHHNTNYTRMVQKAVPPSAADVVEALRSSASDHATMRNIFSIRRIVFQSIAAGTDWRATKDCGHEVAANPSLEIRDRIAEVLDTSEQNDASHFSVLTFVNNLAERLPEKDGHMDMTLFSLRLRALAGMGLLELSAAQLEQGLTSEMWESDVGVLKDVSAAILSWKQGLQRNPVLQTQDGRQRFFRILTGFREAGMETPTASYRGLILHPESGKGDHPHRDRLTVFGRYLELLGSLGATRMLWKEWRTASELLKKAQLEGPEQEDTQSSYIAESCHKALLEVVGNTNLSSGGPTPSLEDCALADYSSIRPKAAKAEPEKMEGTDDKPNALSVVKRKELMVMMDLPLDEWLKRIQTWS